MLRTKENQCLHDSCAISVTNILAEKGYNRMYTDLPGYKKPPVIGGHIPDVYAEIVDVRSNSVLRVLIVEVETKETERGLHTIMQHSAFATFASKYSNVEFEIIIA